jgi:hypothetical protein
MLSNCFRRFASSSARLTTTTKSSFSTMSFYDIKEKTIDGSETSMSEFKNNAVLVVNVACH